MALRTKGDFIKALVEKGYDKKELSKLSLADLKALHKGGVDALVGTDVKVVSEKTGRGEPDSCDVFNMKTGEYVRTYSKMIHGDKYEALAKEFCKGHTDCFVKVD